MANSVKQLISTKKGGMAVPVRSALKMMLLQDFNSFSNFFVPHIKKLKTYFTLLYFWTFAQCVVAALLKTKRHLWTDIIYICTGPPCTLASSKHMRILTLAKRQISFVL